MLWKKIREVFFHKRKLHSSPTTTPPKTQWYKARVNRIDRKGEIGYAFVYCRELKKPVTFSFSNIERGTKNQLYAWKQEQPPQTGEWVLIKDIVSNSRGHNAQTVRPEKSSVSE